MNASGPLRNAIWEALESSHRHLCRALGKARRYPAAVAPFAAIAENSPEAMADLEGLLTPGESVYLMGERPAECPGLRWDGIVACLQMLFPEERTLPDVRGVAAIGPLDCSHAGEMMELITLAFPGYFRPETCRMGNYYGVREGGRLIAMGGERLIVGRYREISGLCTHPEHTGRGLGTELLRNIISGQRGAGAISWLHVSETNHHAIGLYHHLGFATLRRVELHRIVKEDAN